VAKEIIMSKITDALQKAAQEREKKNELQTKQKEGTLPQGVIDLSSEDYEKLGRNIVFFQNKGGTQAQENFRILRTNVFLFPALQMVTGKVLCH
jgi:dynactin complex subunit